MSNGIDMHSLAMALYGKELYEKQRNGTAKRSRGIVKQRIETQRKGIVMLRLARERHCNDQTGNGIVKIGFAKV